MKPVRILAESMATLLAADTAYLANVAPPKVGLIVAPFALSMDRQMADLSIAAGTGLIPLAATAGTQDESFDPLTGEYVVSLKPPAGGWRWETPVGFVGPLMVYGFALGNGAMTVLLGMHALTDPYVLSAENQAIIAPPLNFRIDPTQIA